MGVDAAVDWSDRAGVVEGVIRRRYLRHLLGVVPGTRIGRVRWPRPIFVRPWPWHYWWQAHLLDCLVDAQRRAPNPARAIEIAALARTVRLRNFGSWTNDYYDDIAWFGLAVQRAGPLRRVRSGHHRLDDRDAARPGIRSGPRRSSAESRRIHPHRRNNDLHLLPGGVPGGMHRTGRAGRTPAMGR